MKTKFISLVTFLMFAMLTSCSSDLDEIIVPPVVTTPEVPEVPETRSDTIDVKIGHSFNVEEQPLFTRAGNSNDLVGVQIYHLKGNQSDWRSSYACGVFDNLDNIVFKFVKGNRYLIQMNYYPGAKNIVYNYPDGTFGSPFSYMYGLQSYKLNEPVYFSGVAGNGDAGAVLPNLLSCKYQGTSDRMQQTYERGMTPVYMYELEEILIEENTRIEMDLQLCMMGITLKPGNFNSGTLKMVFSNNVTNMEWTFKPGSNASIQVQVPYNYLWNKNLHLYDNGDMGGDDMQLFYVSDTGENYLLATKFLQWKPGTNYAFTFDLAEREDGSIGIKMPSDSGMKNEEAMFD